MKNLLLWALFIVTWQTWEVHPPQFNSLVYQPETPKEYCFLSNHTEFFDDEMKAAAEMSSLKADGDKINIKMYEAKEINLRR